MSHEQLTTEPEKSLPVRHESLKESYSRLKNVMKVLTGDIKRDLRERFSQENGFIDSDGSIMMKGFYDPNVQDEMTLAHQYEEDKDKLTNQERHWAGLDTQETRENRAVAYGLPKNADENSILQAYKRNKEQSVPNQLEMAITILLHKRFGDRYVVVRASKYDDYFNGIDNVLVNKETGDVICAFDEVRMDERSDRDAYKKERSRKKASQGGATLKYGFTIQDGAVVKRMIHSIPIFCLGLNSEDCGSLINDISYADRTSNPTLKTQPLNETEKRILEVLLNSIREQRYRLLEDVNIQNHKSVIDNLNKVESLFSE